MDAPVENEKRNYGGWRLELAHLLERYGNLTCDQTKAAGFRTHEKRAQVLYASFKELRDAGFKLDDPKECLLG